MLFTGAVGKRFKEQINRRDIYPPLTATRKDLLEAARPEVVSMDELIAYGKRLVLEVGSVWGHRGWSTDGRAER